MLIIAIFICIFVELSLNIVVIVKLLGNRVNG